MMNISPPILIMCGLIGFLVLVFVIFLMVSKRSDKKEKEEKLKEIEKLNIEVKEVSAADFAPSSPADDKVPEPSVMEEPPEIPSEEMVLELKDEPVHQTDEDDRDADDQSELEMEIVSGSAAAMDSDVESVVIETEGQTDSPDSVMQDDSESIFAAEGKEGDEFSFDSDDGAQPAGSGDLWDVDPASEDTAVETSPDDIFAETDTDDKASPDDIFAETDTGDKASPDDIFADSDTGDKASPDDVFTDTDTGDEGAPDDIFGSGDDFDGAVAVDDDLFGDVGDSIDTESDSDIENLVMQVSPIAPRVDVKPPAPVVETPAEPEPPKRDLEDDKRHEKTKRIARVIINDIRNYNPEKLAEGIRIGNIMKTLGVEIERGRQLYIKRVPPEIAKTTNYYREALVKLLADGRKDLFGW